jgi:7,8-dihydroneopterin aldolase/epimerase/oxygenase
MSDPREHRSAPADVTIGVNGICLQARVGVTDEERAAERTLMVDVELVPHSTDGLRSDDLAGTVDYARVVQLVSDIVMGGEHRLIEHLAALLCDRLMSELAIRQVSVTVRKPAPPVDAPVTDAWTRVTRRA